MNSSRTAKGLLTPLSLSIALMLTACGGSSNSTAERGAPQTAPTIAVVPQNNFNQSGNVDTDKFTAVQSNYQNNLKVTK